MGRRRGLGGARQRQFGVRVSALHKPCVQPACVRVAPEVAETQEGAERRAPHAASHRALLSVRTVREHPLAPRQVQLAVKRGVVRLLEHRDVIDAAFVQVGVFVLVHGVHFHAHHAEALGGQLARLADVGGVGARAVFAREQQDLLEPRRGDGVELGDDARAVETGAADVVVAVEAAVHAVVVAVVRQVQRREQVRRAAEPAPPRAAGGGGQLFQQRLGGGRQQRAEALGGKAVGRERGAHVGLGRRVEVERRRACQQFVEHGRVGDVHVREVGQGVDATIARHVGGVHRLEAREARNRRGRCGAGACLRHGPS